jgi:Rrf2 family iron-sulfur cluster assembly transcriptional regulator
MVLSKASEYSIRATVFIALKSLEGEKVNLKEIASQIESPEAFTSKLLQMLKKKWHSPFHTWKIGWF